MGKTNSTVPGINKLYRPLSQDLHPWEKQPWETKPAYDAFQDYIADDKRRVKDKGSNAYKWSSENSWGYRAYEFDLYMARLEVEEMVRYRRKMNDRHRRAAAFAVSKSLERLMQLDPSELNPANAIRLLEIGAKLERMAAGDSTERIAFGPAGSIDEMTAEQVAEALQGVQAEIAKLIQQGS